MAEPSTPLMRQYHALKQQASNALLLFRLGDFYELFYEDAVVAARELEITLTARNKEKGEPVPMCGVPHHAADSYIAKLIQKGHRVAICEQMEDPRFAKKLVKREIIRVLTPGTAAGANLLRAGENNYLAALVERNGQAGLAYVDVSTGEFRATELPAPEAPAALELLNPKELLRPDNAAGAPLAALETPLEPWTFSHDYTDRLLKEHFKLLTLDGCGLGGRPLAAGAAGALLHYLKETQRSALDHLDRPSWFERNDAMVLDAVTVRNLEIVEPLFAGESREITLLHVVDETKTGMGARLLRRRLLRPSLDAAEIEARLDALAELAGAPLLRAKLRDVLADVLDLERLLSKTALGTATPRDLFALAKSLARMPELRQALVGVKAMRLSALHEQLDEVAEASATILRALAEEPPVSLADGGAVRDGYDPALDELRDISRHSKRYIAEIELRERGRTGIASLKVRFNNVFGYYIEISRANLHLAPAGYERTQTLVNAERFTTPELKELESKILDAEEKIIELEKEIFTRLRLLAAGEAARIRRTAAAVAELDCTAALAEAAVLNRYTRPKFSTGILKILGGRHPVIEKLTELEGARFIPNDLFLDPDSRFIAIITGPNMGGKSTYLRQAALCLIMAQAGSFVPAQEALLPLVDRVFTRIGASDNLARGRSTFMVEMTETAAILNTATCNSFVVLDEIGRGTATYDGLALAWAVVEFIHERIGAMTMFATHYHELTELAERLPGVQNLSVTVKEVGDQILFLRRVEPGAADRSYGIEVARLAGLPVAAIERAKEILSFHERTEHEATGKLVKRRDKTPAVQIQLFEPLGYQIAERIRGLDIDQLRPIEALQLLHDLQKELKRQ